MLGGLRLTVTVQHFQIHNALVQDGRNNWGTLFLRKKKKRLCIEVQDRQWPFAIQVISPL